MKNKNLVLLNSTLLLERTPVSAIIFDTFTDTNGVTLENHAPDIAPGSPPGWDQSVENFYAIQSNWCEPTATQNARATLESGIANGIITAKFRITDSDVYAYHQVIFRYQDSTNHWLARLTAGGGISPTWRIMEIVGGSSNIWASDTLPAPLMGGEEHTITVEFNGSNISAQYDNDTPITYAEASSFLTATVVGFQLRPYGVVVTYPAIDDFKLIGI